MLKLLKTILDKVLHDLSSTTKDRDPKDYYGLY